MVFIVEKFNFRSLSEIYYPFLWYRAMEASILRDRIRGALWSSLIADALSMPVHWYYNPNDIYIINVARNRYKEHIQIKMHLQT